MDLAYSGGWPGFGRGNYQQRGGKNYRCFKAQD